MKYVIFFVGTIIFSCSNINNTKLIEEIDPNNINVGSNLEYVKYEYDSVIYKDSSETYDIYFYLKYPLVTNQLFVKNFLDTLIIWKNIYTSKTQNDTTQQKNLTIKEYANSFLNEIIQEAKTINPEEYGKYIYINNSSYKILNPFKNIWIIHCFSYLYLGGAHGIENDSYYTIINNKYIPYIKSIISDTSTFQILLSKYLKKQINLPPNVKLSEIYFIEDDKLPLTDNYFFTNDTFYVCYNPYEIGCYAYGIQRIGIPMSEAKKLMHKDIAALLQ